MKKQYLTSVALVVFISYFSCIWLKQGRFRIELPVAYSETALPLIEVTIQGHPYSVMVDLGSFRPLVLEESILASLEKTPIHDSIWIDVHNNHHTARQFLLAEIFIKTVSFKNIQTTELTQNDRDSDTITIDNPLKDDREVLHHVFSPILNRKMLPSKEIAGHLGRLPLTSHGLLLNFQQDQLIICDSIESLKHHPVFSKPFIKAPFLLDPKGILFFIETDFGLNLFILDSGCTCSMIHNEIPFPDLNKEATFCKTEKFVIGEKDFKATNLLSLPLEVIAPFHGIVGMDFLQAHPIFIDFPNQTLYIW